MRRRYEPMGGEVEAVPVPTVLGKNKNTESGGDDTLSTSFNENYADSLTLRVRALLEDADSVALSDSEFLRLSANVQQMPELQQEKNTASIQRVSRKGMSRIQSSPSVHDISSGATLPSEDKGLQGKSYIFPVSNLASNATASLQVSRQTHLSCNLGRDETNILGTASLINVPISYRTFANTLQRVDPPAGSMSTQFPVQLSTRQKSAAESTQFPMEATSKSAESHSNYGNEGLAFGRDAMLTGGNESLEKEAERSWSEITVTAESLLKPPDPSIRNRSIGLRTSVQSHPYRGSQSSQMSDTGINTHTSISNRQSQSNDILEFSSMPEHVTHFDQQSDQTNFHSFSSLSDFDPHIDQDTPPLSASSVASSKRLEWDNGADIGYFAASDTRVKLVRAIPTVARSEPEGISMIIDTLNVNPPPSLTTQNPPLTYLSSSSAHNCSPEEERSLDNPEDAASPVEVTSSGGSLSQSDSKKSVIFNSLRDFQNSGPCQHYEELLNVDKYVSCPDLREIGNFFSATRNNSFAKFSNSDEVFKTGERGCSEMHSKVDSAPGFNKIKDLSKLADKSLKFYSSLENSERKSSTAFSMEEKSQLTVSHCANCELLNVERAARLHYDSTHGDVPFLEADNEDLEPMDPLELNTDNILVDWCNQSPILDSDLHYITELPSEFEQQSSKHFFVLSSNFSNWKDNQAAGKDEGGNPEVKPHIRWYPFPSVHDVQDIKDVSTQTAVSFLATQLQETREQQSPHHNERQLLQTESVPLQLQLSNTLKHNASSQVVRNTFHDSAVFSIEQKDKSSFLFNKSESAQQSTMQIVKKDRVIDEDTLPTATSSSEIHVPFQVSVDENEHYCNLSSIPSFSKQQVVRASSDVEELTIERDNYLHTSSSFELSKCERRLGVGQSEPNQSATNTLSTESANLNTLKISLDASKSVTVVPIYSSVGSSQSSTSSSSGSKQSIMHQPPQQQQLAFRNETFEYSHQQILNSTSNSMGHNNDIDDIEHLHSSNTTSAQTNSHFKPNNLDFRLSDLPQSMFRDSKHILNFMPKSHSDPTISSHLNNVSFSLLNSRKDNQINRYLLQYDNYKVQQKADDTPIHLTMDDSVHQQEDNFVRDWQECCSNGDNIIGNSLSCTTDNSTELSVGQNSLSRSSTFNSHLYLQLPEEESSHNSCDHQHDIAINKDQSTVDKIAVTSAFEQGKDTFETEKLRLQLAKSQKEENPKRTFHPFKSHSHTTILAHNSNVFGFEQGKDNYSTENLKLQNAFKQGELHTVEDFKTNFKSHSHPTITHRSNYSKSILTTMHSSESEPDFQQKVTANGVTKLGHSSIKSLGTSAILRNLSYSRHMQEKRIGSEEITPIPVQFSGKLSAIHGHSPAVDETQLGKLADVFKRFESKSDHVCLAEKEEENGDGQLMVKGICKSFEQKNSSKDSGKNDTLNRQSMIEEIRSSFNQIPKYSSIMGNSTSGENRPLEELSRNHSSNYMDSNKLNYSELSNSYHALEPNREHQQHFSDDSVLLRHRRNRQAILEEISNGFEQKKLVSVGIQTASKNTSNSTLIGSLRHKNPEFFSEKDKFKEHLNRTLEKRQIGHGISDCKSSAAFCVFTSGCYCCCQKTLQEAFNFHRSQLVEKIEARKNCAVEKSRQNFFIHFNPTTQTSSKSKKTQQNKIGSKNSKSFVHGNSRANKENKIRTKKNYLQANVANNKQHQKNLLNYNRVMSKLYGQRLKTETLKGKVNYDRHENLIRS